MSDKIKIVYDYNAYVVGIKKRCRKKERHQIKIVNSAPEQIPNDKLKELARTKINEAMRECDLENVTLQETRVKEEKQDGWISRSFTMFQDNKSWRVDLCL